MNGKDSMVRCWEFGFFPYSCGSEAVVWPPWLPGLPCSDRHAALDPPAGPACQIRLAPLAQHHRAGAVRYSTARPSTSAVSDLPSCSSDLPSCPSPHRHPRQGGQSWGRQPVESPSEKHLCMLAALQVGGWTVEHEGLTFASVRGAGHMVPYTQPERAYTLFTSWVHGQEL